MSDESEPGLFPNAPTPGGAGYVVLARKYRPTRFEDLIGQEAMVRTIANSFKLGRIPQAYMLTGVRGVGKTTTARLIARALNYASESVSSASIALDPPGVHCAKIMQSSHPDVFEMDAASRTGINDIREILDAVRFAPVMARRKVYIIDEVHMLSTAAFNGLLKTLEEPPPHVTFIFATTEIRKVPVTVLSRCQRFDLKRVEPERLAAHLTAICAKEGVSVEADGVELIARAAEGSVRDALSLLDQAIVQETGGDAPVSAARVRDMLGLADRSATLDTLTALAAADARTALASARAQYDAGADPAQMVRDLMEAAHEIARVQAMGDAARIVGGADWAGKLRALADALSPGQVSRLWQLLLRAFEDIGRAPDPLAALEMTMIRLAAASGLPPPEEAAKLLREAAAGAGASGGAPTAPPSGAGPKSQAPPQHAPPGPTSLEEVVALIDAERQVDLQIQVERYVRLARLAPGEIVFAPAAGMPEDLPFRLARFLKSATGMAWKVDAEAKHGEDSLAERRKRETERQRAEIAAQPFVAQALAAFPTAKIVDVRRPMEEGRSGEVVSLRPKPTAPRGGAKGPGSKDPNGSGRNEA